MQSPSPLASTSMFSLISCHAAVSPTQPTASQDAVLCLYFCTCVHVLLPGASLPRPLCLPPSDLVFSVRLLQSLLWTLWQASQAPSLFSVLGELGLRFQYARRHILSGCLCVSRWTQKPLREKSASYPSLWPRPWIEGHRQVSRVPIREEGKE